MKIDSPVLIPGLDLLNHSPTAKVTWNWNVTACVLEADEKFDGGTEILNNYGPKSNEERECITALAMKFSNDTR